MMLHKEWFFLIIIILFQAATITALFRGSNTHKNNEIPITLTHHVPNVTVTAQAISTQEARTIAYGPNFIKNSMFHKRYAAIRITLTNSSDHDYSIIPNGITPAIAPQQTIKDALEQDTSVLPFLVSLSVPIVLIKGLQLAFFPSCLVGLTILGTSTALYRSSKTSNTLQNNVDTILLNTKNPTLIPAHARLSTLVFIKKKSLCKTIKINLIQETT